VARPLDITGPRQLPAEKIRWDRGYFISNWRGRRVKCVDAPVLLSIAKELRFFASLRMTLFGNFQKFTWKQKLLGGGRMEHFTWETVKKEVMNPKVWRKVITGEKAMVAQVFLAKGAVVPMHQHESEQISYIVEGALKFELEGKEVIVRKGEVLHIPSSVPHSAVALEDTLGLDIFSPIRMDWLTGNDDYLRKG
jgi:quercetin dioxygenase-like cupin family protein